MPSQSTPQHQIRADLRGDRGDAFRHSRGLRYRACRRSGTRFLSEIDFGIDRDDGALTRVLALAGAPVSRREAGQRDSHVGGAGRWRLGGPTAAGHVKPDYAVRPAGRCGFGEVVNHRMRVGAAGWSATNDMAINGRDRRKVLARCQPSQKFASWRPFASS